MSDDDEQLAREMRRAQDIAAGGSQCRVCGCTDNAACWPPCWWVEDDLCSTCARFDEE